MQLPAWTPTRTATPRAVLQSHRWRTAENSAGLPGPAPSPGPRLLDVGCGPGTITVDLAARVAPGPGRRRWTSRRRRWTRPARWPSAGGRPWSSRSATSTPSTLPTTVRRRARPPGAAAPHRPGRRAARDGAGCAARAAWSPSGTPTTPRRPGSRRPGAGPLAGALLAVARAQRRRAGRRTAAAVLGARGRAARRHRHASSWCYASPAEREWWGDSWAGRATASASPSRPSATAWPPTAELADLAAAWHRWRDADDGWLGMLHGELLDPRRAPPSSHAPSPQCLRAVSRALRRRACSAAGRAQRAGEAAGDVPAGGDPAAQRVLVVHHVGGDPQPAGHLPAVHDHPLHAVRGDELARTPPGRSAPSARPCRWRPPPASRRRGTPARRTSPSPSRPARWTARRAAGRRALGRRSCGQRPVRGPSRTRVRPAPAPAASSAWAMCRSWRQMRTTKTAEPANANQNGAVTPYRWASTPPMRRADDQPAVDADQVDAADPALQRGRHGPLPDGDRRRAPDERVRAEDEEDRAARPTALVVSASAEVGERLDDQADPHEVRRG